MKKSRREFIKQAGIAGVAAATLAPIIACSNPKSEETAVPNQPEKESEPTEKGLKLKVGGNPVNRLRSLINGKVKIEGCSINYENGSIGDLNTNIFSGPQTYDITEIGLHPFMLAYANDGFRDYTLLPIFPVRIFRHKSVFIRNDRGINRPEDLIGKKVGTPGYSSSSLTWLRGIFKDEYGVSPEDIHWVISNKDSSTETSGNISKQEQVNPDGIKITKGTEGLDESELLVSGEVDALFHAAEPQAFMEGNPLVERLFPDSKRTEQMYFKKTGIFPIMHTVAVRKSLLDENPWLAEAIFNAYSESKKQDYAFMRKIGWALDSLPWYAQALEETNKVMGKNYWPYGIESNRKALETLFRYSYEQGLAKELINIEEIFAKSSLRFEEE